MAKHRTFSPEFKARRVLEVLTGSKRAAAICREHNLKPQLLSEWKATFVDNAAKVFQKAAQESQEQARMAELERLIGKLTLELEVAKKVSSLLSSPWNRNGS